MVRENTEKQDDDKRDKGALTPGKAGILLLLTIFESDYVFDTNKIYSIIHQLAFFLQETGKELNLKFHRTEKWDRSRGFAAIVGSY